MKGFGISRSLASAIVLALLAGVWIWLGSTLGGRIVLFVLIALFVPIVVGLALLAGYGRQVSAGHAAFFGIGAYSSAILSSTLGFNPWIGLLLAGIIAGLVAFVVGWPVLTLRGHYLVLATIGLNIIFVVLVRQLTSLTGGSSGFPGIPPLAIGTLELTSDFHVLIVASVFAVVSMWTALNIVNSRVGRALRVIGSSETAAAVLGSSRRAYVTRIFVLSAVLAGVSGGLYAHWIRFISPSAFELGVSFDLLVMAVVGGAASVAGAATGTALLLGAKEVLRAVVPDIGSVSASQLEFMLFGFLLVASVTYIPEGIVPFVSRFWMKLRHRGGRDGQRINPDVEDREELDVTEDGVQTLVPTTMNLSLDPRSDEPVARVMGVHQNFGGITALHNVSLEIFAGEVLAVIGPNGAGKTTLLDIVSGVRLPTSGRVTFGAEDVTGVPAHRFGGWFFGRTFQTPRLCPELNAYKNVQSGTESRLTSGFFASLLALGGRDEQVSGALTASAMKFTETDAVAQREIGSLSFGSIRHLELARAIAPNPQLLLLDEPASGLTQEERTHLSELIKAIAARGVAVVLIEHDVPLVMRVADRVAVLHNGEVLTIGTPQEIQQNKAVIEAYFGTPRARRDATAGSRDEGESSRRHETVDCQIPAPAIKKADDETILRIVDVHAGYGALQVLHGVSMTVARGRVTAVLGPNGAGKSTLMRTVSGLLPSQGGRLELKGQEIQAMSAEGRIASGIALVPERRQLFPTMTVTDHLQLGYRASRRKGHKRTYSEMQAEMFELFPILSDRRSQQARFLSGGQQQMLAIARALMAEPELLMLDEPLLGLAPVVIDDVLETIVGLKEAGLGILLVEQNALDVLGIVDVAHAIENGAVVASGSGEQFLTEGRYGSSLNEGSRTEPAREGREEEKLWKL